MMRLILFFTLTIVISYQIVAIAASDIHKNLHAGQFMGKNLVKDYMMCYQTNIHMIKKEIMKAAPEKSQTIVKNFCSCVLPYVNNAYKEKFHTLFSCIRTKSKMKKINLEHIDPDIKTACEKQSHNAMEKVTNKMMIDCKQYQLELNKILDRNKPCGGYPCR